MDVPFFKYHGTGNDFVLFDNRQAVLTGDETAFFEAICHRRFGIGADGVILLNRHDHLHFEMDYFNSDGNRSSMCGNGGRCIVQFAHDLGIVTDTADFIAVDGEHIAHIADGQIKLKMGMPHDFKALGGPDYWIHTGSPHFVRFLETPLSRFPVVVEGRAIRNAHRWAPGGTNVNFVQVNGPGDVSVRTYERGVEDETWSCGTGVTAVAEILKRIQPDCPDLVRLQTPGGELLVHLLANDAPWLQGPAKFVFQGIITLPA